MTPIKRPSHIATMVTERPDAKPRILLVDDSMFSLAQVRRALGGAYEIDDALGGAVGLQKMEQHAYAVVIADLLMPNISGLAFLGHVKSRHPETKIIISSADTQETTAARVRSLGALAFVSKPVDVEELRRIVELALSCRDAPKALSLLPCQVDAFK